MSNLSIDIADLSPQQRATLELRLKKKRAASARFQMIHRRRDSNLFPLSFGQQRLWLTDQLEGGDSSYNISDALRFEGRLDIAALEKTLGEIVSRHEVLRTTFKLVDEQPIQVIAKAEPTALSIIDLCDWPEADREGEVKRLLKAEVERPFDLASGPLFRAGLLRLAEGEHILTLSMHHIVCDGWSLGVFVRELRALYEAYREGRQSPLPELPIQYADFAMWQREWLQGERFESQLSYWKHQLAGSPDVLELPTDRPRPAVQSSRGARHSFVLPKTTADKLKALSKREGVTLFMTLLAAFKALLYRYTGQEDISVGTPIANRTRAEVEELIGFFVNTLVLRTKVSGDLTFREMLHRVRDVSLKAYAHQDMPFERLVEELRPQRNLSYSPLFQVDFALHNHSVDALKLPGLTVSALGVENEKSKFDLMFSMMEMRQGLVGSLRYKTDLFDASTIERMEGHLLTLLEAVTDNPDQRLSELPLLTKAERHKLIFEWNDTRSDYSAYRCMHQLFEEQARKTPDNIAVIFKDEQLSYRQLDEQANKLARYLQRLGVGPEVRVGICVERSLQMMIGLFGILKAGGAYVPLDPVYPADRIAYMLEDSGAAVLLTQSSLLDKLAGTTSAEIVCLDAQWEAVARERATAPERGSEPDNLAYIYYTSGSTGRPKGVAVAHYGIANFILWGVVAYGATEGNGAPIHSSIAADLTLVNFLPLFTGKPVTLAEELPGVEGLVNLIRTGPRYGLLKLTPTHLALLNPQITHEEMANSTLVLVIGADNLVADPTLVWRDNAPAVTLLNEYGPTETVVGCSLYHIKEDAPRIGPMPIGKPIANITMYVLDELMQPVPVGVSGELYIGGIGVARGYWGKTDLTVEKFVPDPFSDLPGSRLYKTGDRARFLPDGNMEFLGRLDYMVKIRGFRIELGEIEAVLSGHPAVNKVMVIVDEETPGEKRLIAYAAVGQGSATATELRAYLKELLPEYMVPSTFVLMESLPLSANGKVDRRALPPPDKIRAGGEESFTAPKDTLELQLAQMWESLLDVRPIGTTDGFFDLGGHSLLAVRLMAQIQKQFGQQITLSVFFQEPTIKRLAALLRQRGMTQAWSPLVAIQPRGSKRPFFCVHSLGGDVLAYYSLAARLGPDQPFYGLQAPQPSEIGDRYTSIEDLATEYIQSVREVQPRGPYHLGGWSFGSVVAFEMAQQIKRQGEDVALLALLDGMSPRITRQIKERGDAFLLAGLARDLARRSGVDLPFEHDVIQRLGDEEGLSYILDELKGARLLDPDVGLEWVHKFLQGNKTRMNALRNYDAQIYDGKITLFRSTEVEAEGAKAWLEVGIDVRDKMRGWDKLSTMPVDLRYVPSYHATMVFEPHVKALAEQLSECIDEADHASVNNS